MLSRVTTAELQESKSHCGAADEMEGLTPSSKDDFFQSSITNSDVALDSRTRQLSEQPAQDWNVLLTLGA